jgi:hypothetical protein
MPKFLVTTTVEVVLPDSLCQTMGKPEELLMVKTAALKLSRAVAKARPGESRPEFNYSWRKLEGENDVPSTPIPARVDEGREG